MRNKVYLRRGHTVDSPEQVRSAITHDDEVGTAVSYCSGHPVLIAGRILQDGVQGGDQRNVQVTQKVFKAFSSPGRPAKQPELVLKRHDAYVAMVERVSSGDVVVPDISANPDLDRWGVIHVATRIHGDNDRLDSSARRELYAMD